MGIHLLYYIKYILTICMIDTYDTDGLVIYQYYAFFQTLTSHSCILWVVLKAVSSGVNLRAVSKVSFPSSAANTIQVYCSNTSTEMRVAEGNCICWNRYIQFPSLTNSSSKKLYATDLELNILVVDTQQWHQYCSRSHHTQCPTHCLCRSPLSPHLECYLPPVAVDQLCKEL